MRFGQVLAVGALALEQVRHRVGAEAVDAHFQPEAHHVDHLTAHGRVIVIEIGLAGIEAVPEVLPGGFVPGPVGFLGIQEDNARFGILLVGIAPHVVVAIRRVAVGAGGLEPGVLVGGVVEHQVHDHVQAAGVGLVEQGAEIVHRAVSWGDVVVVGDIVAVVFERRGIDGQQPDAVDPQVFDVVEFSDQAAQVAAPVGVAIAEGAHVHFVENGVFVPESVISGHKQTSFCRGRLDRIIP